MSGVPQGQLLPWLFREAFLDIRDTAGRPLGEANAPSGYGPAGMVEEICRYPDRRALFEAPMNVSALRQVSAAWPELMPRLVAVRRATAQGRAPTLAEAWRAAMLLRALPVADAAGGLALTESRAACYKVALGYCKVYWTAALVDDPTRGAREVLTPDRFFSFLDDGDWLVGSVQVCAGPRRMIELAHVALVGGEGAPDGSDVDADVSEEDRCFATAWTRLEGLAALSLVLVRERVRANRVGEVPRFGMPNAPEAQAWPGCVALYHRASSILLTVLRGIPGVGPDQVLGVLHASALASDELVASLAQRDTLTLGDYDALLGAELGLSAPVLGALGGASDGDGWAQLCRTLL